MTTSQPGALRGTQKPRVLTRPAFTTEASGIEAIELAREVGLVLDPWQELFVRVALAERAGHLYAASSVAELVARQNGKGGGLEAIVLHGMFLVGDPLTLWTAHQFKTSEEAFLRMRGWIDGSDYLRRRVKSITTANGDEGIELMPKYGGARLRFLARSKSSGRGFSPQRIIWDEAQELAKSAFEAMRPSMRAQRNPQSIFAGTVPGPDVNHPEHWTRMRDRGRLPHVKDWQPVVGITGRLAWCEWSPAGSDDPAKAAKLDLDSRKVWADGNPGLGYRMTEETLEGDREDLDDEGFGREAVSVWPTLAEGGGVLDLKAWANLKNEKAPQPTGGVLYLDVSPDRRSASIAVAGPGSSDDRILLLVLSGTGTRWVVEELENLLEKHEISELLLCPTHQAGALIPDLVSAGIEFTKVTMTEVGQATAAFITGVNKEARYEHVNQPELNAAVANAGTRFNGEAEVWDRRDRRIDISQLVAAAGAAFRYAMSDDYDPLDSVL